jgi:hypothetical protein
VEGFATSVARAAVSIFISHHKCPNLQGKILRYRFNDENYRRSNSSLVVRTKKSGTARHAVTLTKSGKFRFSNGAPGQ